MSKIAILNDTHAGVRNSSDIFLDYQEKFYSDVFFPYLLENNITKIIHLGDYYENRKFVNFKALQRNRKIFLEPLRQHGITMDIIPGNHDLYYKNTSQVCALKELLGYFTSNVNIVMEPTVIDYDGLSVALCPWINSENQDKCYDFIANAKADIFGGHLELKGFEMMPGVKNPHGMSMDFFKRYEMALSGHFHTKSTQGNVTYLGSQMEFTWADVDDPKYFHVLDTETRELTGVRNPITIFNKFVYDDVNNDYSNIDMSQFEDKFIKVVVVNKTDLYQFDKFIDKLQSLPTFEIKIAENFEEYLGSAVEDDKISLEDTTELLESYVDAVETDLDKDGLKTKLNSLYIEAQSMEVI
tara:strand:- start:1520 stop:2584 length:1065 start_codon:yes stop_codon:yes gene_type:complete